MHKNEGIKSLRIKVIEVIDFCPVYKEGDLFLLEKGFILDPVNSYRICMHSLSLLLPYHVALSHGISPFSIGLSKNEDSRG